MIYFELIGRNDQLSEIGDNGLSLLETVSGLMRYDPLDRFSITLSNARFVDYGGYTIFRYDVSNKEFVSYTLDDVYENLVRQIAGDKLQSDNSTESLKQSVERDKEIETLQKQISILQNKIRKEKQLNKQIEINTELKKLRSVLEKI